MDTALRNRLTGAVILVLLAVLLLPELLTGAGGTAARTPSPAGATSEGGAPLQTLQIDLSGSARGPAGSAPPPPEVSDGQADGLEADPAVPPPVVRLPVPEVALTAAPPTAAPPTAAPPAAAPPAAAPPKAAPVDPTATRFYVQVGTFTTRERAETARRDFAKRGFEAIINETTSGPRRLHRVRIGPVADRAAAVALEARLRPLAPDRAIVAVPVAG